MQKFRLTYVFVFAYSSNKGFLSLAVFVYFDLNQTLTCIYKLHVMLVAGYAYKKSCDVTLRAQIQFKRCRNINAQARSRKPQNGAVER